MYYTSPELRWSISSLVYTVFLNTPPLPPFGSLRKKNGLKMKKAPVVTSSVNSTQSSKSCFHATTTKNRSPFHGPRSTPPGYHTAVPTLHQRLSLCPSQPRSSWARTPTSKPIYRLMRPAHAHCRSNNIAKDTVQNPLPVLPLVQ